MRARGVLRGLLAGKWAASGAALASVAVALGCSGLFGDEEPSAVIAEIDAIEGTRLEAPAPPLPTLAFEEGAGSTQVDDGNGVQILQVSPVGEDRRALQVAVLFDRPMVAVTDIDTMSQQVPLRCSPDVPARARWAGTSTAVLVPASGAFPRGTRFECTVPAGTAALDGVTLEKTVTFSFDTPVPRVVEVTPYSGASEVDPHEPMLLVFDQPVEPSAVARHVTLTGPEGEVKLQADRPAPPKDGPAPDPAKLEHRVALKGKLERNATYRLHIAPGIVGKEGKLPSVQQQDVQFTTYGPLAVVSASPEGSSDPSARIELQFTTRVSQEEVAKYLTISPRVEGWDPPDGDWDWNRYTYQPLLLPNTQYTVTLGKGLTDVWGQALEAPYSFSFETGNYQPWLTAPRSFKLYAANNPRELPFKHLNASRVDAMAAPFDPARLVDPREWSKAASERLADASGRQTYQVEVEDVPNRTEIDTIDISSVLSAQGLGWFVSRLSTPDVKRWDDKVDLQDGLFVVTDLGASLKVGPNATDIWVTSLSKGEPVSGAQVELYWGKDKVGKGTTDGDGLVRIEGNAASYVWSPWDRRYWALIRKGEDTSVVVQGWDDGLELWSFGVYGGLADGKVQVTGHLFADRGIYRPGDEVHGRATFREATGQGLLVPKATKAHWSLSDPNGAVLAEGDGTLDDRGGLSVDTKIPETGALGTWTLSVQATGEQAGGWNALASIGIPALAYRAPAFRVEVAAPEDAVAGQEVNAVADARYLFGAKLRKGEVRWNAWTSPGTFAPEGYDEWTFQPMPKWWEDAPTVVPSSSNGVRPLVDGASTFTHRVVADGRGQPLDLVMEAEVEDIDRQTIANRKTTHVHPASFYVGLRSDAGLPKVGENVDVSLLALSADKEEPVAKPIEVKLVRREWNSVREKGMDGQWRWVNTPVDEVVTTHQITTGTTAGSPSKVTLTPKKAGYHVVVATGRDESGNAAVSETGVYVLGAGFVGWGRTDDNHLELVPDKKRYQPGETAKILVKSPGENLRALVTTEREGVLSRRVVTLPGTASTVEIPIGAEHRPNVYVSVLLVQGAGPQDGPDKGRPEVFMGLTELVVDSSEEHLGVTVSPKAKQFGPREEVEVEVAVTRGGKPASGAGVTLYAVDEAVLSLTDYQTPDGYETFYARRGLQVITADARVAAVDRAAYLTKGAGRGGGGGMGEAGPEVRSRFLTTIAWQPDLRAGPDGKVTAKFQLPDNLTTFRIMAVADMAGTGFGSGDAEIEVSRKLLVRPALPRLLRVGDQAFAGVVVHNNTDRVRWVDVTAEVSGGVIEIGGSPTQVKVPANGSVEVPFSLRALEQGDVKFLFKATANQDADALEWPLTVERDVLLDTVATTGAIEQTVTERIAKPDNALGAFGGLDVSVATTALLGVESGLEYLRAYPHECAEQRTSRALGALMALAVSDRVPQKLSREQLESEVKDALSDLHGYQVGGQGLGYWEGAWRPSTLATAYGLELLARAKAAGFATDADLEQDLVAFLRDVISGRVPSEWRDDPYVGLVGESLVASALARAGAGDAGLNSRLFAKRKDLSVQGQAALLEAIVRTTGTDARTAELAQTIAGRSFVEAASASVKENESGRWDRLWGSDDLSTAAALEALVLAGDAPLAPRYALHLASSRTSDRWANTRATAGVLAALAAYAQKYEAKGGGQVAAKVTLAGSELIAKQVPVPGQERVSLPMEKVTSGDLVVSATGGRLYYETRLAYASKTPVPRDEGFTITRSLEWLDGEGEKGVVQAGAMLRVNLTVVTPVVRHDVAVIDRLAAGFEPVNTSLATASQAPSGEGYEGLGYYDRVEEEMDELPEFGGISFDHHEIDDAEVRLYAEYLPPGVHTFRYVVRATSPGRYTHPPATVEEMYEPENFGRTGGGTITIGGSKALAVP